MVIIRLLLILVSLLTVLISPADAGRPEAPPINVRIGEVEQVTGRVSVRVLVSGGPLDIGEFDFLMAFYSAGLDLEGVTPGEYDFEEDGFLMEWQQGTTDIEAPDGFAYDTVRVSGTFDEPLAIGGSEAVEITLFTLDFRWLGDRTQECQYLPIRFCWIGGLGNRVVVNDFRHPGTDRKVTYRSLRVFEPYGWEVTGPTYGSGKFGGEGKICNRTIGNGPFTRITFVNGFIRIFCHDCQSGYLADPNVNGILNEPEDEVLLREFFLYGDTVFFNQQAQRAGSDADRDGDSPTISDLAFLTRLVDKELEEGFAYPDPTRTFDWMLTGRRGQRYEPKYSLPYPVGKVTLIQFPNRLALATDDSLSIVFMVFDGIVTPSLMDTSLNLKFVHVGDSTRILVDAFHMESVITWGPLIEYEGEGELVEVQAATRLGGRVEMEIR